MTRRTSRARSRRASRTCGAVASVLAAVVLAACTSGADGPAPAGEPDLAAARAAADLPPCQGPLATDLPQVTLPCYDGGADVALSGAPGRPMLINLWATWCTPCVDEVPALVRFAERAGERVGVVGVVHKDSATSVYAFAQAFGIGYPLVRDDGGVVLPRYGGAAPRTLLVTADGRVADVHVGAFRDVADIEREVAEHLGVRL